MYGKSFVLVKPDGMNKEIKDEIIQTIQNRSISVVKQQKICLTVSDIENIWPYTQSDIVSRQLFMNSLCYSRNNAVSQTQKYRRPAMKSQD